MRGKTDEREPKRARTAPCKFQLDFWTIPPKVVKVFFKVVNCTSVAEKENAQSITFTVIHLVIADLLFNRQNVNFTIQINNAGPFKLFWKKATWIQEQTFKNEQKFISTSQEAKLLVSVPVLCCCSQQCEKINPSLHSQYI